MPKGEQSEGDSHAEASRHQRRKVRARKAPNEPNWISPLIVDQSGVNIDAFGFAYAKRTQFRLREALRQVSSAA